MCAAVAMRPRPAPRAGFGTGAPPSEVPLERASETGRVNLTNKGLTSFPERVLTVGSGAGASEWWLVEPTHFVDLSFNPLLRVVPREISRLAEALVVLKLRGCGLRALPAELGICIMLKSIDIADNSIGELPADVGTLPALVELDVSGNAPLRALPPLGGLPALEALRLNGCTSLTSLPADIGLCPRLRELRASNCALAGTLPPSLARCASLVTLDVSRNRLRAVFDPPTLLRSLRALVTLDLRQNDLRETPDLPATESLKELFLGSNRSLRELNGAIMARAHALSVFDVSDCSLVALPDELRSCAALTTLDVRNNDITALPPGLGFLRHLRAVALAGNPLRSLKPSLLRGVDDGGAPVSELLAFLRSRATPAESAAFEREAVSAAARIAPTAAATALGHTVAAPWGAPLTAHATQRPVSTGCGDDGFSLPPQPQAPLLREAEEAATAETDAAVWVCALRDAAATGSLTVSPSAFARGALKEWPAAELRGDLSGYLARASRAGAVRADAAAARAPDVRLALRSLSFEGHALGESGDGCVAGVVECVSLEVLSLARCALRKTPPLRALCALHTLSLAGNAIGASFDSRSLPPTLSCLDLRGCSLLTFPVLAAACPRLRALTLAGNAALGDSLPRADGVRVPRGPPDDALYVPTLAQLDLSNCGLFRLPSAVLALPALESLAIEDNDLADVPAALGALPVLTSLNLRGNPQRSVRMDILERGAPAVLALLRARGATRPGGGSFFESFTSAPPTVVPIAEGGGETDRIAVPVLAARDSAINATAAAAGPGIDPVTGLTHADIVARATAIERFIDAGVGVSNAKAACARRDLAVLRAAESRARSSGGSPRQFL